MKALSQNKFQRVAEVLPGIMLCLLVALPSWLLGRRFPIIGGPIMAIVVGIALATLCPRMRSRAIGGHAFAQGVKFTSKKLLQAAVVLLGFEMNLMNIIRVGGQSLLVMLFTLAAAFLTAWAVGRALRLPGNTVTLIGVGTAICGGSAIAATAPAIGASDEDVARSISTIFLFNIAAVFLFPALGRAMGMTDTGFGMWAGTAINDTSSVVAAGTAWSEAAGSSAALQFATIVKLTRTLMIVPITLSLALYTARKRRGNADGEFHLAKVFPWFVALFVLAAIAHSSLGIPEPVCKALVSLGKFLIVMAMAAIGLSTSLKSLLKSGIRPILLGLCCWAAVAVVSLIVQRVLGI